MAVHKMLADSLEKAQTWSRRALTASPARFSEGGGDGAFHSGLL